MLHASALKTITGNRTLPYILFALAMLALSACTGTTVALGGEAAGIWATRPSEPPPADLSLQMAQHDSWCYATMGYPECYAHPQDVSPSRLINVDPAGRYPLTAHAYNETLIEDRAAEYPPRPIP